MTLGARLKRLERGGGKPDHGPWAIVREVVQPSAMGPELVALILRPRLGRDAVQIDRAPAETEPDLRARLAVMCAP